MNNKNLQFALREWWRELTHPIAVVSLLGSGVITGFIGPFETSETLAFMPRLLFWMIMIFATYAIAALTVQLLLLLLKNTGFYTRTAALSLGNCITVSLTVLLINQIVFGSFPDQSDALGFLGTLWAIIIVLTAVLSFAEHRKLAHAQEAPFDTNSKALPPILARLPVEKRGVLYALTVEDHYVRVRTSAGEAMLLMRLRDAIAETGEMRGAQVHRSHWVSFDHIASVARKGDRAILTLVDGSEIPVSRTNLPKIKEAGLLP